MVVIDALLGGDGAYVEVEEARSGHAARGEASPPCPQGAFS
jgi:hypothetical protein